MAANYSGLGRVMDENDDCMIPPASMVRAGTGQYARASLACP